MRSSLFSLALLHLVLAGGCAGQIGDLPTWVGFDEESDDALVVLRVSPPAQVLLALGRLERGGWRGKGPASRAWLSTRDGFVVAQLSPTQDQAAYAVVEVRPASPAGGKDKTAPTYETGFWSAVPATPAPASGDAAHGPEQPAEPLAYGPTGEARIPVLQATPGRVVYAGTIRLDAVPEPGTNQAPAKIGITPIAPFDDMDAVRRFLAEHYPRVTARIVARPLQMVRRVESAE